MQTANNPLIFLACLGASLAQQAVIGGQITERRWTQQEVANELSLSITSQWEWRKAGKLNITHYGVKTYYTRQQLREAGLL